MRLGRTAEAVLAILCYVAALGGYIVLGMAFLGIVPERVWPWALGAVLLSAVVSLLVLATGPPSIKQILS